MKFIKFIFREAAVAALYNSAGRCVLEISRRENATNLRLVTFAYKIKLKSVASYSEHKKS